MRGPLFWQDSESNPAPLVTTQAASQHLLTGSVESRQRSMSCGSWQQGFTGEGSTLTELVIDVQVVSTICREVSLSAGGPTSATAPWSVTEMARILAELQQRSQQEAVQPGVPYPLQLTSFSSQVVNKHLLLARTCDLQLTQHAVNDRIFLTSQATL